MLFAQPYVLCLRASYSGQFLKNRSDDYQYFLTTSQSIHKFQQTLRKQGVEPLQIFSLQPPLRNTRMLDSSYVKDFSTLRFLNFKGPEADCLEDGLCGLINVFNAASYLGSPIYMDVILPSDVRYQFYTELVLEKTK